MSNVCWLSKSFAGALLLLVENDWLKLSRDMYDAQRDNGLGFRIRCEVYSFRLGFTVELGLDFILQFTHRRQEATNT